MRIPNPLVASPGVGARPEDTPIGRIMRPGFQRRSCMPPSKLAHVVFQTNRIKALSDWYCTVLDGRVIYENPNLSFVTYDDEHHRVAFANFAPLSPRDTNT